MLQKFLPAFLIFLFFCSGLAENPGESNFAQPPTVLELLPADEDGLHREILVAIDSTDHARASVLLEHLKANYRDRYESLPYVLLHAKSLMRAGKSQEAYALYTQLAQTSELNRFITLPLARTAAAVGKIDEAVSHYQRYLSSVSPREFRTVALEALDYCVAQKKAAHLLETAKIVQRSSATHRLGQFYIAKSYRLSNDEQLARSLLLSLITSGKADDVTNLALAELDEIDGDQLSEEERVRRAILANEVWNFELVKKYLQPLVNKSMRHSYYYARASFFLGETEHAAQVYERALTTWPNDPLYRTVFYLYANTSLRNGRFDHARNLYLKLRDQNGGLSEGAVYKLVGAVRAQGNFDEALQLLNPYVESRDKTRQARALYLRSRIYFQAARYSQALADIDRVTRLNSANQKEALLWKGIVLEKMKRTQEALTVFRKVAAGSDFYAMQAIEKLSAHGSYQVFKAANAYSDLKVAHIPDDSQRETIAGHYQNRNYLPSLLYLHLYEEAASYLPHIGEETYRLLQVNSSSRLQRYLTIAQLAALGQDFSTSTYYAESFLNNLPRSFAAFSLPAPILKILYPLPYQDEIRKFTADRGVDPYMVLAIMRQESKFKQFARSPAFARGLMQLIPSTAARMAGVLGLNEFRVEQLYRPDTNINLGTRYMDELIREFGNRIEIIAAGYNGGEANVRSWLASSSADQIVDFFSNIDMSETRGYVMIVKMNYELYKHIYRSK